MSKFQLALISSGCRQTRYLNFLEKESPDRHSQMPLTCMNKGITWYESCYYMRQYLDLIKGFIQSELKNEENNAVISLICEMLSDQIIFEELKIQLEFIYEFSPIFIIALREFEDKEMIGYEVYKKMMSIKTKLLNFKQQSYKLLPSTMNLVNISIIPPEAKMRLVKELLTPIEKMYEKITNILDEYSISPWIFTAFLIKKG